MKTAINNVHSKRKPFKKKNSCVLPTSAEKIERGMEKPCIKLKNASSQSKSLNINWKI